MMSLGKIQFAEIEGTYVLKLIGDIRLNLSCSFDNLLHTTFHKPKFRSVIIDLSEAKAIDSTSLGLLAKLSIQVKESTKKLPLMISPNRDITKIVLSMGFEQIFIIVCKGGDTIDGYRDISAVECTEDSTRARVLDAHRVLMGLNENNRKAFCDLVNQLEQYNQPEVTLKRTASSW